MSQLTDLFTSIANAIRSKTGATNNIAANNFPAAISQIPLGLSYIGSAEVTSDGSTTTNLPTAFQDAKLLIFTNTGATGLTTNVSYIVTGIWSEDTSLNLYSSGYGSGRTGASPWYQANCLKRVSAGSRSFTVNDNLGVSLINGTYQVVGWK